jgi:hypothetical protein
MNDNDPTVEFQCGLNTFEWESGTPCIWLCHWVLTHGSKASKGWPFIIGATLLRTCCRRGH